MNHSFEDSLAVLCQIHSSFGMWRARVNLKLLSHAHGSRPEVVLRFRKASHEDMGGIVKEFMTKYGSNEDLEITRKHLEMAK